MADLKKERFVKPRRLAVFLNRPGRARTGRRAFTNPSFFSPRPGSSASPKPAPDLPASLAVARHADGPAPRRHDQKGTRVSPIKRRSVVSTLQQFFAVAGPAHSGAFAGRGASPARRLALSLAAFAAALGVALSGAAVGPAAAQAAECPNQTLREENNSTQLPDCRAYEMVSPPYGGGFNVFAIGLSNVSSTPPNGDGFLVGRTFGAPAGAENNAGGLPPEVFFARSPSGWAALPYQPSAKLFPNEFGAVALGPGALSSIWQLSPTLEGSDPFDDRSFYRREPSGAFTLIGPAYPPGTRWNNGAPPTRVTLEGASNDLSHLLVGSETEEEAPVWPEDQTLESHRSLHEYVGTGNSEPELVGVSGGPGSQQLISQCGTRLGSQDLSEGANGNTLFPSYNAVSASGATVFFTADPGGCFGRNPVTEEEGVEGQGPPVRELYARLGGAETVHISEPTDGPAGDCEACQEASPRAAEFQAASEDGSKVLFTTEQDLLPGNPGLNLYQYDFAAPNPNERVTAVSHLASGSGYQGLVTASPDLSHLYFVATGVLTGPQQNEYGATAEAGVDNLYVYEPDPAHPGQFKTAFIANLAPGTCNASKTECSGDAPDWNGFRYSSTDPQVTPDGRYLLFSSAADLTPDDTSSATQLFRYDSQTGALTRVSIGQGGFNNDGNGNGTVPIPGETSFFLSDDGAHVFFNSTVPLVLQAAASAGFLSTYEWEPGGTASCHLAQGCVYLISDGHDTIGFGSELEGISPTGADVYFGTADSLLPADTNTQVGVYDARVEGGFPAPVPAKACEGDPCQGSAALAPSEPPAATSTFNGPGNEKPKLTCPKGKVRKAGKCVAKHHPGKHKPRAKRAASHNRGGHK